MTCRACEKLITDVLKDVPGVMEVEVSLKLSKAAVRLRDEAKEPDLELLNCQLESHGYRLYPESCRLPSTAEPFSRRLRRALAALLVVGFAGYYLLRPLRDLLPNIQTGASLGLLFILGIVASLSSCLATTGGFMLAYSAETASRRKTVIMHLGRLAAFALGGALLGALGGALPTASATFYGVLAIIFGIGFLGVALSLMDLFPSWSKLGLSLPSSFQRFAERIKKRPGGLTPFLVGAVTFVLPCGFTQTAQALALASGSAAQGFLYMVAFALGTLPVLLGVTALAAKVSLRQGLMRVAIGAVMFFFALNQINAGLSLFGMSFSLRTNESAPTKGAAINPGDVQVVRMRVLPDSYDPAELTVKKGVPVRWEVDGTRAGGCGSSLISRELGISQVLEPGINVFTFTPTHTGRIAFSCGMGMIRGSFNVIE